MARNNYFFVYKRKATHEKKEDKIITQHQHFIYIFYRWLSFLDHFQLRKHKENEKKKYNLKINLSKFTFNKNKNKIIKPCNFSAITTQPLWTITSNKTTLMTIFLLFGKVVNNCYYIRIKKKKIYYQTMSYANTP